MRYGDAAQRRQRRCIGVRASRGVLGRARSPTATGVLVALASVCLLLSCGADSRKAAPPTATIGGQQVRLEIARTPGEQALGLGNRDSLSWGHGMLFVYDEPGFFTFWMKRMRFDIDIVWIRDGRVVGIAAFVPYPRENPDTPATVRAPELVDTVLEVPAGYSRAHGWRRGDTVALSGLNEKTR